MSKKHDYEKLNSLKNGENCTVFWVNGGGGLVYRANDMYLLFNVPLYGGEETYEGTYFEDQLNALLDKVYTWT